MAKSVPCVHDKQNNRLKVFKKTGNLKLFYLTQLPEKIPQIILLNSVTRKDILQKKFCFPV